MISCTSVLANLTMPESMLCSSAEAVAVMSTASANSSSEISLRRAACSLIVLLVRIRM